MITDAMWASLSVWGIDREHCAGRLTSAEALRRMRAEAARLCPGSVEIEETIRATRAWRHTEGRAA